MSATPLRDKLVQWEHDLFAAAWESGKRYPVARTEVALAVNQYEEQALARLALYPELVKALRALEEHLRLLRGIYQYTQLGDDDISRQLGAEAQAILAQAETIEKGDKG